MLSSGRKRHVHIKETVTGVTAQGKTIEEAIENLKEAVSLYLEEEDMPDFSPKTRNP